MIWTSFADAMPPTKTGTEIVIAAGMERAVVRRSGRQWVDRDDYSHDLKHGWDHWLLLPPLTPAGRSALDGGAR